MKISEYIHKKQTILERYGVTTILTPEEQINDTVEQLPLDIDKNQEDLADANLCPYCILYLNDITDKCKGCPMVKANNKCGQYENNTYTLVIKELQKRYFDFWLADIPEILELAKQYNEELE